MAGLVGLLSDNGGWLVGLLSDNGGLVGLLSDN